MTDPMAAVDQPPPDLDARYVPFPPVTAWLPAGAELDVFDQAAAELARLAERVGPGQTRAAVDTAVRAAAFDTGAIEGLYPTDRGVTFSVAEQAAAWEAVVVREAGRDAVRHFQAQLAGFALVLDAVTGATGISSAWVRALHETICGGQDTFRALTAVGWQEQALPRGEFKRWPNHVREPDGQWHPYAPPDRTPGEVQRLVDEIHSDAFAAAHPVAQAAFVHHALVAVHPFADGNGRVARALASVFLYRAARVPLHIWADQRGRYLTALRAADRGDRPLFVDFIRDVAVDTIRLVTLRLRPAGRRTVAAESRPRAVVSAAVDPDADDRLLAGRVLTAVADRLRRDRRVAVTRVAEPGPAPAEYRAWSGTGPGGLRVAAGRRSAVVSVFRADPPYALALVGGADPLPVRRDQVDPALTEVTAAQLAAWADDLVDRLAGPDEW